MLHPLCQARLVQYKGEKGMNKWMDEGNEGTDSFQFGWLPGYNIYILQTGSHCSWPHIKSNSAREYNCKARVRDNGQPYILHAFCSVFALDQWELMIDAHTAQFQRCPHTTQKVLQVFADHI